MKRLGFEKKRFVHVFWSCRKFYKMSDGQISLYILYNGQKKAFSLNPNTILQVSGLNFVIFIKTFAFFPNSLFCHIIQTTLAEAAVHFKLDVNRCKLKQRSGAFVDCSQSFRFCKS